MKKKSKLVKLSLASLFLSISALDASPKVEEIKIYDSTASELKLETSKDKLLVVLWATWCPDCKTKLKGDLKKLQNDPTIDVLALNTEKNQKRVQEFIQEEGVITPVAYDSEKSFRKSLELFTVPSWATFSRDSDGKLRLTDKGSAFESAKLNAALGKSIFQ